jgi:hypothetical protein
MPKPPLPPEKYKGKQAVIRMTEAEYTALSNIAISQNMTISQFMRKLLKDWAKTQTKKDSLPPLSW